MKKLITACALLLGACAALGQSTNGTIAGVVTDPSGAAITNATVTVKSVQTGDSRTIQTNNVGAYRVEAVLPGTYTITVTAPNFSQTTINGVSVSGSVTTSINASLKIGAAETVEVNASAEQLQTESGELSHTIAETEVHNLPISNLNPYSLATTLPGVTTVSISNFTNGTSFAVNGLRPRSNNFLIEGQDNNDAGIQGQGLQPGNLDAVKELSVLTNAYAAEFGHGGGSVSNMIFKSGTNNFHGAGWDLLENSSLNARDKGDILRGTPKAKSRENIYGFDFGGPIKKDKLFFFTSYQWDAFRSTANGSTLTVPSAAGYNTLAGLTQTPTLAAYLKALGSIRATSALRPLTMGGAFPNVEIGSVQRTGIANLYNAPEFDAKGDYLVTPNDTIGLRYIRNSFTTPYDLGNFPSQLPGYDTDQAGASHNAGITYSHVFTPTLVNEARLSYGRIGFSFLPRPESLANQQAQGPIVSISNLTGFGIPSNVPQGRFHNTYQYQDAVSWTKGTHSMKFGVDVADIRVRDAIPFNFFGTLGFADGGGYAGLANMIDNFGGTSSSATITFGNPVVHTSILSRNFYAQDAWKLKSNLTITYGLRYEYQGTPANVLQYPAIDSKNVFDPSYPEVVKQKPDYGNWGPRLGLAYSPKFWDSIFGDGKTVLRAGAGVFYDGIFTNILDNNAAASPNAIAASKTSSVTAANPRGTPNWTGAFSALSPVFSPFATQTTIMNNLVAPRTYQWNADIQRELPWKFMLSTAYVGTRGTKLYGQDFLNPINPATGGFTNTSRGQIVVRDNSGDSEYHGLDVSLDRTTSNGLYWRTSYTFSRALDDVSEIFTSGNASAYPMIQSNLLNHRGAVDWGLSAFNRSQRLTFLYDYKLPKLKMDGNAFLSDVSTVLNGWEISGTTALQTGAPVNIEDGLDVNGDGISNDRPDLGNVNAPLTSYARDSSTLSLAAGQLCWGPTSSKGKCAVNPNTGQAVQASDVHWIIPALGSNGNVGRNSYILPGSATWNMGLGRSFPLSEQHAIQFRAEAFNVFNHGTTGTPGSTLIGGIVSSGTSTFLNSPLNVQGNRTLRFWFKYAF